MIEERHLFRTNAVSGLYLLRSRLRDLVTHSCEPSVEHQFDHYTSRLLPQLMCQAVAVNSDHNLK